MDIFKKDDGFTLIEMIISFTIIIILIVTFSRAVLVGLKSESTTSNLDYATSMSASILDFLADADNFKIIVDNEIDISSGEYEKQINDFIKNDLEFNLNPNIKNNFISIMENYTSNNKFNYLNKSKIIFKEESDIVDDLYRVKIVIYWQGEQGEGKYEVETMIGAD